MITDIKRSKYNDRRNYYIKCFINNKYLIRYYIGYGSFSDLNYVKAHKGLSFLDELVYQIDLKKIERFYII